MFKQFLVFIFFFAHIVLFGQSSDLDQKLKAQQEQEKLEKQSEINLNLGYYSYPDYEPMAFWGIKDIN